MPNEHTSLLAVVRVEAPRPRYKHSIVRRLCTVALSGALAIALICFLFPGHFLPDSNGWPSSYLPWAKSLPNKAWPGSDGMPYEALQKILLETPSEIEARRSSKYYTAGPHLAGKNLSQAVWTSERWAEYGVDSSIVAYETYINYSLDHRLALLEIDRIGTDVDLGTHRHKIIYECSLQEDVLLEDDTSGLEDRVATFHGYSASGNVTAPYVYVNFGTWHDFEDLIAANVSLKGKIAIAKYGHVFRGLKIKRAQELGMIGVVMYTDPQEDGAITKANGYPPYPEGPARNPSSVQRGSTLFSSACLEIRVLITLIDVTGVQPGDPTTPGVPSLPGAPRVDPYKSIPSIPSLPISYRDALPLLKALNGHGPNTSDFNEYWQGGGLAQEGINYNIGPSPDSIVLNLMNAQEYVTTPIWNVIGVINGSIPDEVVILGNHRDAWIAGGAGDPISGSSALNEVVRGFGLAMKAGWKPLRTLVFASWDGEEYGLLGSTEWVEEYLPWLSADSVAYLNVDMATVGPHLVVSASPLLNDAVLEALQMAPSPNQTVTGQTVFDVWDKNIKTLGSGSDYTAFQDFAGISSLDLSFKQGPDTPVYHYHSNYDSLHWMDTFGDPGWHYHITMARIWALIAASLCEAPLLRLNTTDYALGLAGYLASVKEKTKKSLPNHDDHAIFYKALDDAMTNLRNVAMNFDAYRANLATRLSRSIPWWRWWSKTKLYQEVQKANSKSKLLERQFLFLQGLDDRPWFKHVVFAPGRWTGYAGATFPGLLESFEDGNMTNAARWRGIILDKLHAAARLVG